MLNELLIESINKSYKTKKVLHDIYLRVKTGDIVGLLGRNGCGKSTLLNIIFGTLEAESKFIKINDDVLSESYKSGRIKLLPQNDFLPKYLNVSNVIKAYFNNSIIEITRSDKIINKILKTKIKNISGGELRYLETFLLMNLESDFLLLDEPFNGVSPIIVEEIKSLIFKYSKIKGFIITDHDYRNVLAVSNRIYLMINGFIKEIKNKDELRKYGYIPNIEKNQNGT